MKLLLRNTPFSRVAVCCSTQWQARFRSPASRMASRAVSLVRESLSRVDAATEAPPLSLSSCTRLGIAGRTASQSSALMPESVSSWSSLAWRSSKWHRSSAWRFKVAATRSVSGTWDDINATASLSPVLFGPHTGTPPRREKNLFTGLVSPRDRYNCMFAEM